MGTPPFPPGFFDRADTAPDREFFADHPPLPHLDEAAVDAVGDLYDDLEVDGRVLELYPGRTSYFHYPPDELVGLGLTLRDMDENEALASHVEHDLNVDVVLPFPDAAFDDVVCTAAVEYLARPLEVFADVARVLRPGGRFICTFSSRCFESKAIHGWLATDAGGHVRIVRRYFDLTPAFGRAESDLRTSLTGTGDPLWAVWAPRAP